MTVRELIERLQDMVASEGAALDDTVCVDLCGMSDGGDTGDAYVSNFAVEVGWRNNRIVVIW